MADYILAIDQGTTGSTALLVDRSGRVAAARTVDFPNYFPQPGHVEHDAEEIWSSVGSAITGVREQVPDARIAGIGITNQRETCLFWGRDGAAAHRALVWQDRRTAPRCEELRNAGWNERVRERTGLVLDPYFSATKAEWLLRNDDTIHARAARGELRFGTIDSYLADRLTGEHVTDPSNASRTLLYDIHRLAWDEELCALFGVPAVTLPRIVDSSGIFGRTRGVDFLPDGIPVAGLAGDQQAALFGQLCFEPGMAKATYGTGAFLLLNTGTVPVPSHHGLLTTVAWSLDGIATYALEGSAFVAGSAVQWLRDGLGLIRHSAEVETLARSVLDCGGVQFVPALAGLGAPYWKPEARGLISGLTRGSTAGHIARAVLEGIALQLVDIFSSMAEDAGRPLREIRVDGGASRNDLL
ncbi:MAG: glycerol kinase GlpK, partial [Thermoanaerobaculia bacterium]